MLGICLIPHTYYVGVQIAFDYADMKEVSSMIQLTIELINNKTDGFFDEETAHVYLRPLLNESGCTSSTATGMLIRQQSWANSHGHALDGVIGDFCTDSSLGIANFGKIRSFTIIYTNVYRILILQAAEPEYHRFPMVRPQMRLITKIYINTLRAHRIRIKTWHLVRRKLAILCFS